MSPLRSPTAADIPTVAALLAEHWPEPIDHARIEREWTSPRIELERDARIDEGAYVLVEDIGEGRAWADLHGANVADALAWAETRAVEMGARRIFSGAWATNELVLGALDAHGYALVRHSSRMEIDLADAVEPPNWPDGVEVRTFQPGEERVFYRVHEEAFRDMWEPIEESYEDWAHWHLNPPRFEPDLWFLASEGEACGVALCHPHPTATGLGWVDILAVRRRHRRRGIGRALLLSAFERMRERGLERAGLGVDAASITGAHTLYESVGMRETRRFDVYEKELA